MTENQTAQEGLTRWQQKAIGPRDRIRSVFDLLFLWAYFAILGSLLYGLINEPSSRSSYVFFGWFVGVTVTSVIHWRNGQGRSGIARRDEVLS